MATTPSRFDHLFMPDPFPTREKGFDACFPQSELITSQVADWISAHLYDPDDNPLADAAEFLLEELGRAQDSNATQALKEIVSRYVEDNDELFWEETKSEYALERLNDCDFSALAWYFQPDFTRILEQQSPLL